MKAIGTIILVITTLLGGYAGLMAAHKIYEPETGPTAMYEGSFLVLGLLLVLGAVLGGFIGYWIARQFNQV